MGQSDLSETRAAAADGSGPIAAGARLAATLLGWPCGFVVLIDTAPAVVLHGRRLIDDAALMDLAATVAAIGRAVAAGPGAPPSGPTSAGIEGALPAGCRGMIATPLFGAGGAVLGIVGGLDDAAGSIAPAATAALVDLAALLADSAERRRESLRLTAVAAAEADRARAAESRERRLRAALDCLPHYFWVTDVAGRYVDQNAWDREAFGDLVGRTAGEADPPLEEGGFWQQQHRRVLSGATLRQGSWRRHPGSQGDRWVETVMAPLVVGGAIEGLVGLTIDRTEEAVAEQRLAAAEGYLRAAIDALPFPFFICDLDGRRLMQNSRDQALWGDCIGKTCADIDLPSELAAFVPKAIEQVRRGETVHSLVSFERQGRRHHEDAVYAPVFTGGVVTGFAGLGIDLTVQVEQERRLRESEAALADFVDTASDWVWATDVEHRLVQLTGLPASPKLPPDRVVGRRRWDIAGADPAVDPLWRRHRADLDARRPFRGFVFSLAGIDQTPFWVEINGNPVFDEAGGFVGYRGTGRDITDRVLAERRVKESEARLADYLATASDWLWETDATHRVTTLVGWPVSARLSANRLIGHRRWEIVDADPETDPVWRDHVRDLQARRPFRGFTYAYSTEDHPEIWIELSGNPVFDAAGSFKGYRGTARDITARRHAELALREAHAKLDAMAQSGLVGMTAGHGFMIEEANETFLRMLGLDRAALGRGLDWRQLIAPDLVAEEETTANQLAFTGAVYTNELVYRRSDGGEVPVLLNSVVLDGTTRRWFALVQNLTPMKLAEAKVRELAERDGLTGLANRHVLFERLRGDLAERRRPGGSGALLLLDLDSFKVVNDSLGHEAGDRLLQIIGARLSAVVRDTDTVARVGGDEFAIILRGLQGPVVAAEIAQKILDVLREPLALDGQLVRPNGSLGIALFPSDGSTPEGLLKQADIALYKAKAKGRGAYCFFEPALLAALEQRRRLTDALEVELASDAFSIVLQPRLALADGRPVALEALARWRHRGTDLLPGSFIGLAEQSGRMLALGRQLRGLAFAALRRLDAAGLAPETLSLNLAASELKERDFAAGLAAELAHHALSPARVEIEVTENLLLDREGDKVTAGLRELRRLGVAITLDDFGTGYASLTHLRCFPLDRLKIDRSIVQDIGVDADETVIVRSIINLAHTLGMTVVAEGVETAEQLAFLRLHGCDFAQGHYLCEPLPPAALEAFLAELRQAGSRAALPVAMH